MGKFFKGLWKAITWTRIATLNLIFLLFVTIIIVAIVSTPRLEVPAKTALFVAPAGTLVDQLTYNPSTLDLFTGSDRPAETKLRDLVEGINRAASDSRITSMVLKLNYLQGGGMSKLEELGQALEKFKDSGKRIYAYSDNFTQQQYFLASYADEIYLNNLGTVLLTGFGMYQNYFKEAANKLDLDFHIFRVGTYKDAVEPFMRNEMSSASREHNSRWISSLWKRYTELVEIQRDLPNNSIKRYIELWGVKPDTPVSNAQMALDAGLVDKVVSRVELLETLQRLFGEGKSPNTFDALPIGDYLRLTDPPINFAQRKQNTIGLITAAGTILDGEQGEGAIGSDTFSSTIQKAREDTNLKALIIRIDSGGGSAFASEVMRQEIAKTKNAGIPVYISMGSVAASGGYWMSVGGSQIWATPSTITGSIGVWALYPNFNRTLKKFGVNTDGIRTEPLASALNPSVPLSKEAGIAMQRGVDNIYQTFLSLVAEARESDTEAVHVIAQGRVWTGMDAKELGLVDRLGTLEDVIATAAADSNLSAYEVVEYKRPLSPKEEFMRALMEQTSTTLKPLMTSNTEADFLNLLNKFEKSQPGSAIKTLFNGNAFGLNVFASCLECIAP